MLNLEISHSSAVPRQRSPLKIMSIHDSQLRKDSRLCLCLSFSKGREVNACKTHEPLQK